MGGGLAGSCAYLPLQEEQVAAVRAGAPGFLCAPARYCFSSEPFGSLRPPGPAPWPRPPTAYPVSYEVSAGPCLLGWKEAVRPPSQRPTQRPRECQASITLCSSRGLGSPRSTPPLPCEPIDESRPLAWYRQWHELTSMGGLKSSSRPPFYRRDHQVPVAQGGRAVAENLATRAGGC